MKRPATPLRKTALVVALLAALSGCAYPGENRYYENNVGYPIPIQFGTLIAARPIEIKGTPTGLGALIGGTAGGLGGSTLGHGTGSGAAAFGLALLGLGVGALAEQAVRDRPGMEYTVTLQNGQTVTLAQNLNPGDQVLRPGERVALQYGYGYARLLPANNYPTEIQRPPGITVR